MADHVDQVLQQWSRQRPDLDVSAMGVIGRMTRAARLIETVLGQTFTAHGLDRASFDVLATLRRSAAQRLTPTALMRASMVSSGAITQRLARLEARGLVTRVPNEADGRGVYIELTDEGRATIERVLPDHVETEERLLAGLSEEQRSALAEVLRALLESLGDQQSIGLQEIGGPTGSD